MQFFHKQNPFKVIFKFKSQLNLTKNDIKLGGQFLFPICLDYIGSVFGFCRFHQSGFNSGTFSKKIKYIWPIRFSFQQLRNSFTHALRSCNLVIKMDHEIQILKVIYRTYGVLHRIHQGRRIFRAQAKEDLSTIILIFFPSIIPRYTQNLIGMPALFIRNIFDRQFAITVQEISCVLLTIILISPLHCSKVCLTSNKCAQIKMFLTPIVFLRSKKLVLLLYYSQVDLTSNRYNSRLQMVFHGLQIQSLKEERGNCSISLQKVS